MNQEYFQDKVQIFHVIYTKHFIQLQVRWDHRADVQNILDVSACKINGALYPLKRFSAGSSSSLWFASRPIDFYDELLISCHLDNSMQSQTLGYLCLWDEKPHTDVNGSEMQCPSLFVTGLKVVAAYAYDPFAFISPSKIKYLQTGKYRRLKQIFVRYILLQGHHRYVTGPFSLIYCSIEVAKMSTRKIFHVRSSLAAN